MRDKLSKLIDLHLDKGSKEPRDYIGASSIGSDCLRSIWYEFKGESSESIPVKYRKIWAVGKHLENLIIDWVKETGLKVETNDFTYTAVDMPYFQGHFDGILHWRKIKYILEIKTAKDASFKIFVNKGLKIWNPRYYAQIQAYMGMSGIFSTYILVLNKDNSDLSDELVMFEPAIYEKLKEKAKIIHDAVITPPRISNSPLWFQCKLCKYNKVCHS